MMMVSAPSSSRSVCGTVSFSPPVARIGPRSAAHTANSYQGTGNSGRGRANSSTAQPNSKVHSRS